MVMSIPDRGGFAKTIVVCRYLDTPVYFLQEMFSEAAADESTGGVAFLTRPPQAAKTAYSPSGLR